MKKLRKRTMLVLKSPLTHRVSLFLISLIALNLLYPERRFGIFIPKEGSIADRDYIAPYTFAIRKTDKEIEKERREAKMGVAPLLSYKDIEWQVRGYEGADSVIQRVIEERGDTINLIAGEIIMEIAERGLVDDMAVFTPGPKGEITVRIGEIEERRSNIFDLGSAVMWTKKKGIDIFLWDEEKIRALVEVVRGSISPNLLYLEEETEERRRIAAEAVNLTKGVVLKGEMIVRAHDPVTREAVEKLTSLAIDIGRERAGGEFVGRNLIFIFSFAGLLLLLFFLKREILLDTKRLLLIAIVYLLVFSGASITVRADLSAYLTPLAMASILFTILIGVIGAVASVVALSFLVSMVIGTGVVSSLFPILISLASVMVASRVRKFSDFAMAIPVLAGLYLFVAVGLELYLGTGYRDVITSSGFAAVGGIVSGMLALGLLPLFEKGFAITTRLTMRELTDLNHPLLKELSIGAPGTYNHSMFIAAMVERAADSISANSLVAKAGAYYHDIGKLKTPLYFVENQREIENPHDSLRPRVSASILLSHVKDGIERAERVGLPREVVDIIAEHHGQTLMESLYYKAKEEDETVAQEDFRYKGPSPRTKESALVMLADAVEASVRSLKNPTSNRIIKQITKIVKKRVDEGEMGNVDLTLKEMRKIEEAFFPILMGLFHPRIAYEGDRETGRQGDKEKGRKGEREK